MWVLSAYRLPNSYAVTCGILLLCTNYLQMTFSELELDRRWQKRGIMFKSGINSMQLA